MNLPFTYVIFNYNRLLIVIIIYNILLLVHYLRSKAYHVYAFSLHAARFLSLVVCSLLKTSLLKRQNRVLIRIMCPLAASAFQFSIFPFCFAYTAIVGGRGTHLLRYIIYISSTHMQHDCLLRTYR
jgi:hypothetical protein